MMDLIYADSDGYRTMWNAIADRFPNAKIADASDFIHTDRFEVHLPDADIEAYYAFLSDRGFAENSLHLSLAKRVREPPK